MRIVSCFTVAALAITALSFIEVGGADTGWQVRDRASDSGRWYTSVYVSSYAGTEARLTVRTSRRMRVKISTSVSCSRYDFDADFNMTSQRVRRELTPSYRWIGPQTPLVRRYGATFAGAQDCSYSVFVSAGRGRLGAVLETR